MWIIRAAIVFLIVWGIWWLLWTLIFAANDIVTGRAPVQVVIGIIVALFVVGWVVERRKRKKGGEV